MVHFKQTTRKTSADSGYAYRQMLEQTPGLESVTVGVWKDVSFACGVEHRAYWALKKLNLDMATAKEKRMFQLNELDEFHLRAYEINKVYKEKVKTWHDRRLVRKSFVPGQQVVLFNTRLRLFPGKLKSRWSGPFIIKNVFPHGAVEIFDKQPDQVFKVNGQRLEHYYGDTANREVVSTVLSIT
ncbi:uncharacterized protein LOC141719255 [Apium graveolens]|uniref:uncharacterized protein LOC141719255 n=1 Tax=Apium graveolens TaxID=4045 RepID=UPI003D7A7640